jgi:hypothetical protein
MISCDAKSNYFPGSIGEVQGAQGQSSHLSRAPVILELPELSGRSGKYRPIQRMGYRFRAVL